jgi:hypothetical protein
MLESGWTEAGMSRKRYPPEEIISKRREAGLLTPGKVVLARSSAVAGASRDYL